ncbi:MULTISPECIES: tRNA adenosine(34) deaminase TadA [unclassified Endozoicomonas]|uniref:tRNA adenosine(34) deaminase TadA n=1 Tax=unclassified Endozoicomonas TaxID=2644528 RepID=UPI00214891C7|nr:MULTISPECIES: tRNA adenosine(34) deaminase TadA [unclassified Endozoicomonas]
MADQNTDSLWMREALKEAEKAREKDEVPVGAVVVRGGEIIGRGFNQPISGCNPVAHAEVMALQEAAATLNNYRLVDCELYVTLEPCTMCAGAIIHSRLKRVIFGAPEPKAGALVSQSRTLELPYMNYRVEMTPGVLEEECSEIISSFFRARREAKKAENKRLKLC